MTPLRLSRVALLASLAISCQPSATVRYNGRERPPIVSDGAAVRVIAGRVEPPEGHEVLGVITTQCTALDGATGLNEAPCTEESMAQLARDRAAERGATALFELVCGTDESDRFISGTQQPGSGAPASQTQSQITNTTTIRTITTCRATVLRSKDGKPTAPVATTEPAPGEQVVVSGQAIAIAWTPEDAAADLPARDASEVGEMQAFPAGYRRLGVMTGRCLAACARSLVPRGLKQAAARRGALALADLDCQLEGERWHCRAAVVGPAVAPKTPPPLEVSTDQGGAPADAAGGAPAVGEGGAPADGAGGAPSPEAAAGGAAP